MKKNKKKPLSKEEREFNKKVKDLEREAKQYSREHLIDYYVSGMLNWDAALDLVDELRNENKKLKEALSNAKAGFELELPGQWPAIYDKLLKGNL